MKTLIFATGAALLSVLACAAPSTAADPLVLSDVAWQASSANGKPHLRVSRARSNRVAYSPGSLQKKPMR